ncbi:MAG: cell division protein FtsA [Firmicutes bacterium HGW-Firmicutes-15]|nr:MAG: cell division protein FtsA [Firmicutes bacterium HGW-Firmicutes-15]
MSKRNIVVGLDVGTSSIKAVLGEINHINGINVLGLAQVPSSGLRKGNIVDIESTARSIDACLNELERLTGVEIMSALTGFSGISISAVSNHAVVAVGNPNYEITREDKERVLHSAQNIALPPDKTIVQVIERQYIIDGYDGVTDPVGMVGSRLEVEIVVIIAATAAIQNLQRSAQRINLHCDKIAYNQLLVAESVLTSSEKEMGVAIVDMGGGTTEISVFSQGSILSTSVLPIGGDYISKDLAIVLRTSIEDAVRIKEDCGVAAPEMARDDVIINARNIQGNDVRQVSQQLVADIISARVIEMVEMIYTELQQLTYLDKLAGGLVLTGGGAQLAGIVEVMEGYMDIPVRLGLPENIKGLVGDINIPRNSVALGALIYGFKHMEPAIVDTRAGVSSVFHKVNYWLKDLFS